MGKKHKHPEHENLERWLVSYADFITLLFATFVVLYALSQADLAKFKTAAQSIKDAFNPAKSIMSNPGGIMKGSPKSSMLPSSGNSILKSLMPKFPDNAQLKGTGAPTTASPSGQAQASTSLQAAVQQINKQITAQQKGLSGKEKADKQTELKIQDRGVVISFASNFFFEPGSAALKPAAYPILDKLAPQLKTGNPTIHVEGHTDNQLIATAMYPSNWELSSARASSVVRYLVNRQHMEPSRIAAIGYADTRPIASNATEASRRKNRRVDIVILSQDAAQSADAGPAQNNETVVGTTQEAPAAPAIETVVVKDSKPQPAVTKKPVTESAPLRPVVKIIRIPIIESKSHTPDKNASSTVVEAQSTVAKSGKHTTANPSKVPTHISHPLPIQAIDIRPSQPNILNEPANPSNKPVDKAEKKPYPFGI